MRRFFTDSSQIDTIRHQIPLRGEDVNHIKNVLRMKEGDEIWVSDGQSKEYCCVIESFKEQEVLLHILYAQEPSCELPSSLVLFQALPKSDKMDPIIQKSVELGVSRIVPVMTRRCVVKLTGSRAEKRVERYRQIAREAAGQCRRMKIPEVDPVTDFSQALEIARELDLCLIPYELAQGMEKTREILFGIRPGQSVGIFIGPEGGFEEQEVEQARQAGAVPLTLGRRILRTETAGPAVLAILMFLLEGRQDNGSLF